MTPTTPAQSASMGGVTINVRAFTSAGDRPLKGVWVTFADGREPKRQWLPAVQFTHGGVSALYGNRPVAHHRRVYHG